jgi:membrane protease YdiL (CAAX protease family)
MHSHDARRQVVGVAAVVGATAVAGMGFCWLQWRSRSVVAPIVVHAAVNGAGLLAGWLGSRVDVRVGQDQP